MYLHSGLRQTGLRSQALSCADAWVMALLELLLKFLQLVWTECSPISSKFGLFRTVQTPRLILAVNICNNWSLIVGLFYWRKAEILWYSQLANLTGGGVALLGWRAEETGFSSSAATWSSSLQGQNWFCGPHNFLSSGHWRPYIWGSSGRGVKLTSHLHIM